ncbi:hypothetical protein [Streptomyces johnsoniae]|uniref:DNA primase n=1 Tax=Streptomyces johnsoniae TaxID=3075532 RepID=A0ABU2SCH0_9ACTN|nr:hypothetical protein [Streptomyces sp. DSM 41886]MDT0445760.1 hypothetical protein [Streptomyces sp. DSM 41886]
MALGLAVTTGYVLGRTKKAKLALALGGVAVARKVDLTNPRLLRAGDQLRGTARSLVAGPLDNLADGLHGRTEAVQEQLNGAASQAADTGGKAADTAKKTGRAAGGSASGSASGSAGKAKSAASAAPAKRAAKQPAKSAQAKRSGGGEKDD